MKINVIHINIINIEKQYLNGNSTVIKCELRDAKKCY